MSASTVELVNPIGPDEIPGWMRAMATTFLGDPASAATERRIGMLKEDWEPERAWGARDRGRWVATLRTETRRLTVPGPGAETRELPVDALTNVTVAATHRRRRLLRGMLDGSLRAARERGDALSILIAAEWPIYGRFGYAPAVLSADYELRTARPGSGCPGDPSRVRQIDRDEFGELGPAVFAAARRERAGQIDRPPKWFDRVTGRGDRPAPPGLADNWLVHEGDDGPDGLLAWKAAGDSGLLPPFADVEVWDLVSAGQAAYRNLWSYLSGIDLIESVRLHNRPADEPVRWLLTDGRALVTTRLVDFVWVRLLDVCAALEARRYAVPGELVLEVVDEDGDGFAAGRYRLAADGDEVSCEPTEDDPDVGISQRALASIYLGGFSLREQALAGAVTELRDGAVAELDVMFSTPLAPWTQTWF